MDIIHADYTDPDDRDDREHAEQEAAAERRAIKREEELAKEQDRKAAWGG